MRNVTVALDPDTARRLRIDAAHADKSVSAHVAGLLSAPATGFAESGQAPYRSEAPVATTKITLSLPTDLVARLRVDAARAGKSMSRHLADLIGAAPETAPVHPQREALNGLLNGPRLRLTDEAGRAPSRDEGVDRGWISRGWLPG
jgi:plasmid stability protein